MNFWVAVLGGFVAGYIMTLAGYWMEGLWGLPRMDMAGSGMKYLGGEKPGWWVVGIIAHHIDSIVLGLLYATLYPTLVNLGLAEGILLTGVIGGIVFGFLIWVILVNLIVMPLSGAGAFGSKLPSAKPIWANLILHLIYGVILGAIYVP